MRGAGHSAGSPMSDAEELSGAKRTFEQSASVLERHLLEYISHSLLSA
jgi:hypothetical protein